MVMPSMHSMPGSAAAIGWCWPDSGLSLLRRIRQHDGDTPLVMITGRSDRESVLAVRPLAISAYITNKVSPQVQFCREQVLMRLAAALCNVESPATVERLRRLAGLG